MFVSRRLREKSARCDKHAEKPKPCPSRHHVEPATSAESPETSALRHHSQAHRRQPVLANYFVLYPTDVRCPRTNRENFGPRAISIANGIKRQQTKNERGRGAYMPLKLNDAFCGKPLADLRHQSSRVMPRTRALSAADHTYTAGWHDAVRGARRMNKKRSLGRGTPALTGRLVVTPVICRGWVIFRASENLPLNELFPKNLACCRMLIIGI